MNNSETSDIHGIVLYPIDPYLVVLVVVLLVGSFQWAASLHSNYNSRPKRAIRDEESARSTQRKISAFSLPLALVNFYRTLAFRTTLSFGSYVVNLAELVASVGYLVLLLVWTFIIRD